MIAANKDLVADIAKTQAEINGARGSTSRSRSPPTPATRWPRSPSSRPPWTPSATSASPSAADNGEMVQHLKDISDVHGQVTDSMGRMEDHLVVIEAGTRGLLGGPDAADADAAGQRGRPQRRRGLRWRRMLRRSGTPAAAAVGPALPRCGGGRRGGGGGGPAAGAVAAAAAVAAALGFYGSGRVRPVARRRLPGDQVLGHGDSRVRRHRSTRPAWPQVRRPRSA